MPTGLTSYPLLHLQTARLPVDWQSALVPQGLWGEHGSSGGGNYGDSGGGGSSDGVNVVVVVVMVMAVVMVLVWRWW